METPVLKGNGRVIVMPFESNIHLVESQNQWKLFRTDTRHRIVRNSGVSFTKILQASFTQADIPKAQKDNQVKKLFLHLWDLLA